MPRMISSALDLLRNARLIEASRKTLSRKAFVGGSDFSIMPRQSLSKFLCE